MSRKPKEQPKVKVVPLVGHRWPNLILKGFSIFPPGPSADVFHSWEAGEIYAI